MNASESSWLEAFELVRDNDLEPAMGICRRVAAAWDRSGWSSSLKLKNRFIDTIRLHVRGGTGGMGLPKYKGVGGRGGSVYVEAVKGCSLTQSWEISEKMGRKEQNLELGIPEGVDLSKKFRLKLEPEGGRGQSVFEVKENEFEKSSTLKKVLHDYSKNTVTAESGKNSRKFCIYGEAGKDKVISVPVGVTVYDKFFRILGELNEAGHQLLVAEGGPGGSPTSNPPYSGSAGFSQVITIDLKIIADVGLVGFPNAGKSTLLKAISRARPKIAAYSFTTLHPNIGVVQYPDYRQIQLADLPGLIEGASENVGLGHKFLKHVERSNVLLMVVDVNGFQLGPMSKFRNCLETIIILNKELELYNKELLNKPAILAINKMDLPGASTTFREISPFLEDLTGYASRLPEELRPEKFLNFDTVVPISAKCDNDSVQILKDELRKSLDKHFIESMQDIMTEQEMELMRKIRLQNTELTKVEV